MINKILLIFYYFCFSAKGNTTLFTLNVYWSFKQPINVENLGNYTRSQQTYNKKVIMNLSYIYIYLSYIAIKTIKRKMPNSGNILATVVGTTFYLHDLRGC